MKSKKKKWESLKEQSKRVKALELEKTKPSRVIAAHEETGRDQLSRLDSVEAILL